MSTFAAILTVAAQFIELLLRCVRAGSQLRRLYRARVHRRDASHLPGSRDVDRAR